MVVYSIINWFKGHIVSIEIFIINCTENPFVDAIPNGSKLRTPNECSTRHCAQQSKVCINSLVVAR